MEKYLKYKGLLLKKHGEKGWAITVGAGISYPVFPSWEKLVEKLIEKTSSVKNANVMTKYLLENFSPDAVIQGVQNKLALPDTDFADLLRDTMYEDLITKLKPEQWKSLCLTLESTSAHNEKDYIWEDVIDIRENFFKGTSVYDIAKIIHESIDKGIAPSSILTFNGESLLFVIINSFEREKFLGKQKLSGQMGFPVRRITHSIFGSTNSSIPLYHCHGLLTPPLVKKRSPLLNSNDKLVFSESDYLNLANSNFSWQSTTFISNAINNRMVFIGVSLTDSNMRRWLSWIHDTRVKECENNGLSVKIADGDLNCHYWINKSTGDLEKDEWIENCVSQLGVCVIWIDDWNHVDEVLRVMLSI